MILETNLDLDSCCFHAVAPGDGRRLARALCPHSQGWISGGAALSVFLVGDPAKKLICGDD